MIDVESFSKYSLFGGIQPEEIAKIASLFAFQTFQAGTEIIRECERNDTIYFIQSGKARVTRRGMLFLELVEGDSFGEMEVLDVMPAVSTIHAVGEVRTAAITNRALREIYRQDPKIFSLFMMNLARDLSRRLRRMDELACGDYDGTQPLVNHAIAV